MIGHAIYNYQPLVRSLFFLSLFWHRNLDGGSRIPSPALLSSKWLGDQILVHLGMHTAAGATAVQNHPKQMRQRPCLHRPCRHSQAKVVNRFNSSGALRHVILKYE